MFETLKPLLDSGILNEDTKVAISEAWETKLVEAKEAIRSELREEFARRYDYDKNVMVEALDKMVTESLTAEIAEFNGEKTAIKEDRVKMQTHMVESAGRFNDFMVKKLAEEIQDLRTDRKENSNSIARMENFVINALAEEIQELHTDRKVYVENVQRIEGFVTKVLAEEVQDFAQDKQSLVETKVRLVASAKDKLAELQQKFIERNATLVKEAVTNNLKTELTQLKEDVQSARENLFGRRIFEAFASEFGVTHLNESKEMRKMQQTIAEQAKAIKKVRRIASEKEQIAESTKRELRMLQESAERKEKMSEMLKPLNQEKAKVMRALLENVQTNKLGSAFEKYLPVVLNNSVVKQESVNKVLLSESRSEITGDKTAKLQPTASDSNVNDLKRLAGI